MAVKLLVCGFEKTGKSTITSAIEEGFVINFDRKEYGFKIPHTNLPRFFERPELDALLAADPATDFTDKPHDMFELTNAITLKLGAYFNKFGKTPRTVVIDTVTQLYSSSQAKNLTRFTNFDIHTNNNKDTLDFNGYIEDVLIKNGINVIIVAHTTYDEKTARHIIPASGQFAKAGSWLSVVNDAIFIENKAGKLKVHQQSLKFPCRSTLKSIKPVVPIEEYDINKHIADLEDNKSEFEEFVF